ncbi:integrase catalytic domain-containing protein [Trichonephila clavipes]|nr:integrase catalytic domain-containing protein [Trichonephila clavipes]
MFLQQLWQCKLDWDDVLPNSIANEWREFVTTLKCIEEVKINRFIMADNNVRIVLQGFADASEAAYGAVVYLQCFLHNGAAKVSILASKSRVAPIRVISIPRLELCACVLLAQLVKKIHSTLRLNISDIVLHTDSTIALAWLNTPANRLKTFMANRVAKVQELTEGFHWNHVPSVLNLADLVSRGLRPCDLPNLRLWWHGPQFLEKGKLSSEETSLSAVKECEYSKELKTGSSSDIITSSVCVSTNCVSSILSTLLRKNSDGLLRVGCRLSNSDLPYVNKHPAILPGNHNLTVQIIVHFHKKNLHTGASSLLHYVREKFWSLNGRSLCRKVVHECLVCFKSRPLVTSQLMGNLPRDRVVPDYPFNCSGQINTCARVDAIFVPRYSIKSRYKVTRVANRWGPQVQSSNEEANQNTTEPERAPTCNRDSIVEAIQERLQSMEQHLHLNGKYPTAVLDISVLSGLLNCYWDLLLKTILLSVSFLIVCARNNCKHVRICATVRNTYNAASMTSTRVRGVAYHWSIHSLVSLTKTHQRL